MRVKSAATTASSSLSQRGSLRSLDFAVSSGVLQLVVSLPPSTLGALGYSPADLGPTTKVRTPTARYGQSGRGAGSKKKKNWTPFFLSDLAPLVRIIMYLYIRSPTALWLTLSIICLLAVAQSPGDANRHLSRPTTAFNGGGTLDMRLLPRDASTFWITINVGKL